MQSLYSHFLPFLNCRLFQRSDFCSLCVVPTTRQTSLGWHRWPGLGRWSSCFEDLRFHWGEKQIWKEEGFLVQIHPGKQVLLLTGTSNRLWPVTREGNHSSPLAAEQVPCCRHPETSKGASIRTHSPLALGCETVDEANTGCFITAWCLLVKQRCFSQASSIY